MGDRLQKYSAILIASYQGYILSTWLDHLTGVVFARFLHYQVSLPSPTFPYCIFLKEITVFIVHLKDGKLYSPSLRAEYPHKLLGILLCERFVYYSSFIYLFNHLVMSVWTQGHLFYILGYNLILCYLDFAQIVPALIIGRSFSWLLYPFDIPPSFCFLSTSYFLEPQNAPRSSCISTPLVLRSAIFPRSPGSF